MLFSGVVSYGYLSTPAAVPIWGGEDAKARDPLEGVARLHWEERTNYPFVLSVDDFGHALVLEAIVSRPLAPLRVCDLMEQALHELAEALEKAPWRTVRALEVLPPAERARLIETWNQTQARNPGERCVHQVFEEQVRRTPAAIAVVHGDLVVSYAELNLQANRLAHGL